METTCLSSKGQVILPKSMRDARHWMPGTEFEVKNRPEGVLLRPKKCFATTHIAAVVGRTGYRGLAQSLEEMESAIAQGGLELNAAPVQPGPVDKEEGDSQ